MSICEKCQDVGFIEHNAGLLVEFCDCEIGKEVLAKKRAIYSIPEETLRQPSPSKDIQSGASGGACEEPLEYEAGSPAEGGIDDSGTKSDNTNTGKNNPSEPKQPQKQTKKKRSKKRHRKAV